MPQVISSHTEMHVHTHSWGDIQTDKCSEADRFAHTEPTTFKATPNTAVTLEEPLVRH